MKTLLILSVLLPVMVLCPFTAYAQESAKYLTVFAAASMTETLTQAKNIYEANNDGVKVICNFDSSGTLKTQIQEGAVCDVFISAAPRQMNQLQELGLILDDTRYDLLENKIALAVPSGNPRGMKSFDDLAERLRAGNILLAVGNSDVPAGQYALKIFAFYGLGEQELAGKGVLTYGSNVKEVTSQVSEAAVDCGIIYATDAHSAGLEIIDTANSEMCGQVIYPAAIIRDSANKDEASKFLEFLKSDEAGEFFKLAGFTPIRSRSGKR